jgi:rhodanese-related sulfurtransferase
MPLFSRLLRHSTAAASPGWIEADVLSARLATGPTPSVIDVRGLDEFTGPLGHITGAINVPLAELGTHLPELIAHNESLVLVCKTDRRSSSAAQRLLAAGAGDVVVLRGGMERWRTLGLK